LWRRASTRVVFPAPDGAERTKRIPVRLKRLLKVLDLFADFFELGLTKHDALRNRGIVRFCAKRVQFAKDFLSDEFERATDRLVSPKMVRELREVTFHAGELFRNIGSIGEKRDLFH